MLEKTKHYKYFQIIHMVSVSMHTHLINTITVYSTIPSILPMGAYLTR